MKVTCKHCGSENITESNTIEASYPVTEWEVKDGVPEPADYGAATVHWDTSNRISDEPYWCRGCDRVLQDDDLVVSDE